MTRKTKIVKIKNLLSHAELVRSARQSISFAVEIFKKDKIDLPAITNHLKENDETGKALEQSQNVLEELVKFNQTLIDASPVGIASYDGISGNCLSANDAIAKILGTSTSEVLEQNFRTISTWQQTGLLKDAEATLLNRKSLPAEVNFITSFGKEVWIDYRFVKFGNKARPNLLLLINDITERRKSEAALKESESNLQTIFENTSDGFILTDIKGSIKLFNNKSKAAIILNVEREMHVGDSIFDFIHESRKENFKVIIAKVLAGETVQYDHSYQRKTGEVKWYIFTISPVQARGSVEGLCITAIDISARVTAEIELKESEFFNKGILASLDAHIAVIDKSGLIISVNKAWDDFAKANGAATLDAVSEGGNYFEVCKKANASGEPTAGAALDGILAVFNKEKTVFEQVYPCHSPSEDRWFVLRVTNFGMDESKVVLSHHNITGRKKAEHALSISESNLSAMIENTDAAIYSLDKDLRYITFNNRLKNNLKDLYGVDIKTGDHVLDFSHKADLIEVDSWHKIYSKALNGEAIKFEKEFNFNNVFSCLNFSIHPIWEDRAVIGLSCFVTDVTEHKLSQIRLNELNQHIQQDAKILAISNEQLEQFAYVISHDLQEPLRMVTSFLTLLEKKYGAVIDETGKSYVGFAVDGAMRMRQIILDLLEYSRVAIPGDNREQVDPNELMNEIQLLFTKKIADMKAVIIVDELPRLNAYRAPLRQIFQNLVGNALKYCRNDVPCEIQIKAISFQDHWQFSVADNGIGIAKEYFDKIFIIFQRLHTKEAFSGTGLGLAVTKKIVEHMGGKIWVESVEGKGSTFYFTLPRSWF